MAIRDALRREVAREETTYFLCTQLLFDRPLFYDERRKLDDLRQAFGPRLPLADRCAYIAHGLRCQSAYLPSVIEMLDRYAAATASTSTVFDFADEMASLDGWPTLPLVSTKTVCQNPYCRARLPRAGQHSWRKSCESAGRGTHAYLFTPAKPYVRRYTAHVYEVCCLRCARDARADDSQERANGARERRSARERARERVREIARERECTFLW